jgi:hypothetical protein
MKNIIELAAVQLISERFLCVTHISEITPAMNKKCILIATPRDLYQKEIQIITSKAYKFTKHTFVKYAYSNLKCSFPLVI